MNVLLEMTDEKARRMLALSRELHWAFPTSQGTPIIKGQATSQLIEQAVQERESYATAARVLLGKGEEEGAVEIASNDNCEKKPSQARSLALYGDALLAFRQGKIEESRQRSQAALDAALVVNDQEALTLAYLGLSRVAFADGDYDHSLALAVKARDSACDLDRAMGQAPLFLHASATRLTGDYDQAAALFEQSLDLNRKIGDQGMVGAELQNLAFVEIHRRNVDAAERYVTECEKLGPANDPYNAAMTNLTRAMIAFARGDKNMSRTLLERAQSMLKEAKVDAGPDDQFEFNWLHGLLEGNVRD